MMDSRLAIRLAPWLYTAGLFLMYGAVVVGLKTSGTIRDDAGARPGAGAVD